MSCAVSSPGEAATNLMNDARIRDIFINRGYCECDNLNSMSSGSMSPDLGDTGHQGPAMSPQWEGELELELNSAMTMTTTERRMIAAQLAIALRGGTTQIPSVLSGNIPCGT